MRIEDQILLEENEIKPNRYVANVMLYAIPAFILVDLLNEIGVFHVELMPMRTCCVITVLCAAVVQFIGRKQGISSKRNAKYWIMSLLFFSVLAVTTILSQWSEVLLALPITIAMQYHNRMVTRFSVVNSLIIALISAPLGVYLGLNQINYYEFLISTTGYQVDVLSPIANFDVMQYVYAVLLYISVPRCIVVGALSLVAVYITRLVSSNIRNRAEVTYLSTTDIMTGVLNRLSYENKLDELIKERASELVCVYADADGLHELNNKFGHNAGDRLLKTCAQELSGEFGSDTYRIGGDEFVSFITTGDMDKIDERIERIRKAMAERSYHVSIGAQKLEDDMDILELVRDAETKMYESKHAYYSKSTHDRRKNRS